MNHPVTLSSQFCVGQWSIVLLRSWKRKTIDQYMSWTLMWQKYNLDRFLRWGTKISGWQYSRALCEAGLDDTARQSYSEKKWPHVEELYGARGLHTCGCFFLSNQPESSLEKVSHVCTIHKWISRNFTGLKIHIDFRNDSRRDIITVCGSWDLTSYSVVR